MILCTTATATLVDSSCSSNDSTTITVQYYLPTLPTVTRVHIITNTNRTCYERLMETEDLCCMERTYYYYYDG